MRKPTKRYDATFKRDAVELGVCDVTLRNWRDRHLAKSQPIETDGKKISAQQLAQELRKTQRELQIANRRNEILKKALGIVFPRPAAERYALMKELSKDYPLEELAWALEASRSGYYRWLKRTESQRAGSARKLSAQISEVFEQSHKLGGKFQNVSPLRAI